MITPRIIKDLVKKNDYYCDIYKRVKMLKQVADIANFEHRMDKVTEINKQKRQAKEVITVTQELYKKNIVDRRALLKAVYDSESKLWLDELNAQGKAVYNCRY